MKKAFVVVVLVGVAFFVGIRTTKGKPAQQDVAAKSSCHVPKEYGDFKGMSGQVFIFENPTNGTIKTLTCESNLWHAQIQIIRD